MRMKRTALYAGAICLVVAASPSWAQHSKNENVEVTAAGETEDEAIANGVKDILDRALESIAGDESAGDLGERFYAAHGNDPEKLRKRYFTSDFRTDCKPSGKRVRCIIEGEIKFAALDNDVKKLMHSYSSSANKNMVFAANLSVPKNPRNNKLVTAIGREFETSGHRFEIKDDMNFHGVSMKITDIRFVGFRYDPNTKREDGALDVNFELWYVHPEKNYKFKAERIASDVATVSTYVAGTNPDALAVELETKLITAASRSFVQKVNSQIVGFMQRK
jgi:hypothetical protein